MTRIPLLLQEAAPVAQGGDTAWLLVSTALVLLMVPGLACFYGGLVRGRAVLNTMLMSLASLAVMSVVWIAFGYSVAFSPGSAWIGGLQWVGMQGVGAAPNPVYSANVPHLLFAAFQMMFAGITVALISGAVVERMRFAAFTLFALLWGTLVYLPLAHWVWADGGWLRTLGALDFAGGTVVHISAGVSALLLAKLMGPRHDVGRTALLPHNVPMTLLGTGLLWFGWFGFNAGSALAADGVAANAAVTTHTAAAAATLTWVLVEFVRTRHATAVGAATGAVAGLVAITPAAGFVTPLAAIAIGALGATCSYAAIQWRPRTRIDDALDVFACHGVAGIAGAVLTGVFATTRVNAAGVDGLLAAGNARLVGVQLVAVLATVAFVCVATPLILALVKLVVPARVTLADELAGIDGVEHQEEGYHGASLADFAGPAVTLGQRVVLPASEVYGAVPDAAPGV
ncbi:MAG: ammonium transporter [Gemmatimonadaceae bacterium]|nr:ammonium transporter [Gemmatimonadaceae bacterium]